MNTMDMLLVQDCLDNPVRSRTHQWVGAQQAQYNLLNVKGRRLYDNLRTKHDFEHIEAWVWSAALFGRKDI